MLIEKTCQVKKKSENLFLINQDRSNLKKKLKNSKMKRNSKSQEKLNPENSQNFTRLEVPYAFGTLVITPYLDQESNRLLKVCDEERGYCFGSFSLADNQNLQTELDNVIKCSLVYVSKLFIIY